MYSDDMRWRAIVLSYIYNIDNPTICSILGIGLSSLKRWIATFMEYGVVREEKCRKQGSRYPPEVFEWIDAYAAQNPCFYIEELQLALKERFPQLKHTSIPTLCRCLRFDLKLSKKVLTKRAREATADAIDSFYLSLEAFYQSQDQLLFIDETAKDNRASIRKLAWSRINTRAIVKASFERGTRYSFLAAYDITGFIASHCTTGTFTRHSFHKVMIEQIIPLMNPYPLPRSILILDNAKIHCYAALVNAVEKIGALVFFLPPYCPHLSPIEIGFALMKGWIQKHAHLAFKHAPAEIGTLALQCCTSKVPDLRKQFESCGYFEGRLVRVE